MKYNNKGRQRLSHRPRKFSRFDGRHFATTVANSQPQIGHTIIDVLIARAFVFAYLDQDFTDVIALARQFAKFAEGRVSAE